MTIIIRLLPALLLAGVLSAQTTAYEFRTVLRPGMNIGGHVFTADTIGNAAISDTGEVAFIARWPEGNQNHAAVFSLHRLVASEGDVIDGQTVAYIPLYSKLSINGSGTVAYEAFCVFSEDLHLFIERHHILAPSDNPDFRLSDEGQIIIGPPLVACESSKCSALPMLPHNKRGQVVIALNTAQGPFLLVGTPTGKGHHAKTR
jgi:hypothetical protein